MIHIFIINSHAGHSKFSAALRNHLAEKYSHLEYHIFQTREAGNESKLISEIIDLFGEEKLRIYCCGGLGTLSNAIRNVENFDNLEFAYYPKGFANDFLRVFGSDESKFGNIDNLIDGEVRYIDYIKTNHGNCLNSFSVGLDSEQVIKMTQYRDASMFGIAIPYLMAFMYAILLSRPEELEIIINGEERFTGRFSETFFGNGGIIGGRIWFDPAPNITDGLGKVAVYKAVNRFNMIRTLIDLSQKKMDHKDRIRFEGFCKSISLRRRDGTPFVMDFDGEIMKPQREWTATMIQQGFPFVIPKGVELK